MRKYISRRLLLTIIVLFGIVLIVFALTRVLPADPARKWAGSRATEEQIQAATVELGLDKPLHIQFGRYLVGLLHGDLGYSYRTHRSVTTELIEAIPATVELVIVAVVMGVIVGIFFGVYSAKYNNRLLDHTIRFVNIGSVSIPPFWTAIALQLIFYGVLHLLPLGGRLSTEMSLLHDQPHVTGLLMLDCLLTGKFAMFKDAFLHIILPAIPLSLYPSGVVARQTRSALLEVLGEDYITAGRSYGINESFILWSYALKNTMGATVTVITLTIGYQMVNTFLIESIFSWPGIGKYVSEAVMALDYPAIMGVTLFSAVVYLILNFIADLIIALDPRIRV
ncbi:MAG: ABC transporter permease [Firmicutes bacterium]|nr:ABC transporter permease [Bacillota bacterium]